MRSSAPHSARRACADCGWHRGARAAAGLLIGGLALASAGPLYGGQICGIEASKWAPHGSTRTPRPRIAVTFTSTCGAPIDASSVRMTLDDETVTAKTEGEGAKVTVVYVPSSALLEEADHSVSVQVSDQKGAKGEKSWTFMLADSYQR